MSGTDYTLTTNYSLYKPIPNADIAQWGSHLNLNADTIDGLLHTATGGVAGPFLPMAGGSLVGPLLLQADPTGVLGAATKQYVDGAVTRAGGPFLPLAGGTVTGATTLNAAGTALSVTNSASIGNTLNTVAFNATGTATFGAATNKQVQILGGAAQAFVSSVGGQLTIQSASGYNININPLGNATNLTLNGNFAQNLFFNGYPAPSPNNSIGAAFGVNADSAVMGAGQGVYWVSVGGNVGAILWMPTTAVTVGARWNNGGNIYTCTTAGTTGTTGPTGTGTGIVDGSAIWNYVSSDHVGIRSAISLSYNVRSPAGPTATAQQKQWPVQITTFNGSSNQGGTSLTSGAAVGVGYAGGDQSWLFSGATNWQSIVGRELDVGIFTGASATYRMGINLVSYGNLNAAISETAIATGSSLAGGSSGIPWRNIIRLGEGAISTAGSGSQSIISYAPRPAGALAGATYSNPTSALGIDLQNIIFTTAAFRAPGNGGIDPNGYVFSGAAKLSTSSSAVSLDAPGSIVTAVASLGSSALGFQVGDQLYDPAGSGTIITINAVSSGSPTSWTLTKAGGVLGTPPSNPVVFYGGSGTGNMGPNGTNVAFNLTWTRVATLSLNPSGQQILTNLSAAATDAAAATAGVPIGGLYNNSGVVHVRLT